MYDRGEARIVIGGNIADPACVLGFRVDAGIGAADKPEHRRHAPLCSERSEILAGRCRPSFLYAVCGKIPPKPVANSLGCLSVVRDRSITVQRRDLRLPWRA